MRTERTLLSQHVNAKLAPVPRALSASCGTCVRYAAEEPMRGSMDRDFEKIVKVCDGDAYATLFENE